MLITTRSILNTTSESILWHFTQYHTHGQENLCVPSEMFADKISFASTAQAQTWLIRAELCIQRGEIIMNDTTFKHGFDSYVVVLEVHVTKKLTCTFQR